MLDHLGQGDSVQAYVDQGQDAIMLPSQRPAGSNAWRTGVDEWGCVWQDGTYVNGVVDTPGALEHYSPAVDSVGAYFDPVRIDRVRQTFPEHCLMFGTPYRSVHRRLYGYGYGTFFFEFG